MDKKSFIWSIISIIFGMLCQIALFLEDKQIWLSIVGSCILCLGITSLINSFKVTGHGYTTKITPTKEIKEILIEQYKYCDLNYCDKLIKVFYSQDSQNRILFLMMKNNTVVVRKQTLIIYPDDRTITPIWIGQWITQSGRDSFYADVQIAIREYQIELNKGFEELVLDEIPPIDLFKNPEFIAEIKWKKEKDGGRKTIPYGNRYIPQIVIRKKSKEKPLHSIFLRNIEAIGKYKTIAFVKYVYDTAPNDLYENLVFDICEGSKKVATGVIKAMRENIDI
ncbi:MAG: hypothetical protein IJV78_04970 [Clostridia bacterium]|nr:hypothetical protein [Clostridia bacterium]